VHVTLEYTGLCILLKWEYIYHVCILDRNLGLALSSKKKSEDLVVVAARKTRKKRKSHHTTTPVNDLPCAGSLKVQLFTYIWQKL